MDITSRFHIQDIPSTEYTNIVIELENDLARELYNPIVSPEKRTELIKKMEEGGEVTFSRYQVNFIKNKEMASTLLLDYLVTNNKRISILQGNLNQLRKGGRNKVHYHSYYLKTEADRSQLMRIFDAYITEAILALDKQKQG